MTSGDARKDSTTRLVAEAEALRGSAPSGKKPPRTRQLVRDAERLIGREEPKRVAKRTLWVLVLGVAAAAAVLSWLLA